MDIIGPYHQLEEEGRAAEFEGSQTFLLLHELLLFHVNLPPDSTQDFLRDNLIGTITYFAS